MSEPEIFFYQKRAKCAVHLVLGGRRTLCDRMVPATETLRAPGPYALAYWRRWPCLTCNDRLFGMAFGVHAENP